MNLTAYVHDLDPVIWQVTDSIALRWYGVAYLMGFIGGYFLLSWLSRSWPCGYGKGAWPATEE